VAAARLLSFLKMSPDQAQAFSKQKVLRFSGLTGQRGWARLILDRLNDFVLPPSDSKGSTLDPDTVAHEHHSFFFPDNGQGAANAASSAGAAAAEVLVCFSIMLFVKFPPWEARKTAKSHFSLSPFLMYFVSSLVAPCLAQNFAKSKAASPMSPAKSTAMSPTVS
jgi:hypothetical protein